MGKLYGTMSYAIFVFIFVIGFGYPLIMRNKLDGNE